SRELFAHGVPTIDAIRQASSRNCYFLSAVAGYASARPTELADLIETNSDGGYTVHFPGKTPIKVSTPTTGELAAYNVNPGDGIWLAVLLKAYGQYKLHKKPASVKTNSVEAVAMRGGSTGKVVSLLTGHGQRSYNPISAQNNLRGIL